MRQDAIAIVGYAFELPQGINTLEALSEVLVNKRSLISQYGSDSPIHQRWSTTPHFHPNRSEAGKTYTFAAGLLNDVELFDAEFFAITPREARHLDPRQRRLLQLTWQALEQAAIAPATLRGSNTAVYVGVSGNDYSLPFANDPSIIGPYTLSGNACSIAANRISYQFDLKGPSVAVDTACSSSLVALHQACEAIDSGQADSAIVATSSMHLHPLNFVGFAKAHMLSQSGHCYPFDERADGYVRSEGNIVLYIKPLALAQQQGDPIHAVINASAINSDGNTSSLPVPCAKAQAELMQCVLKQTNFQADDIDYYEAHGTGTPIGDPIEAEALAQAIAQKRDKPLPIGSFKGNIGHLEVASGLASVIKVIAMIKQGCLYPSAQFTSLNPQIDADKLNLNVVEELVKLDQQSPLLIGINSFGFGGSNACVLLQGPPQSKVQSQPMEVVHGARNDDAIPLVVSAASKPALPVMLEQYLALIDAGIDYHQLAFNAACRRQLLTHGIIINGNNSQQCIEKLRRIVAEEVELLGVVRDSKVGEKVKTCFVYGGNGCQWLGMGRELIDFAPCRERFVELDNLFKQISEPEQVIELLKIIQTIDSYDDTRFTQPVLFAIQVVITDWLQQQGLQFDTVVGHSLGEIAAAWAAGMIDLEQACKIVYARSQAQALIKGHGHMAVVAMSEQVAMELIASEPLAIEIAGVNAPRQLTVAGDEQALSQLKSYCDKHTIFFQRLNLDYPFHSSHLDKVKNRFEQLLGRVLVNTGKANSILISTVTGDAIEGAELTHDYWWKNCRQRVEFAEAIFAAIALKNNLFIEIGAAVSITSYINSISKHEGIKTKVVPSLKRDCEQINALLTCFHRAWLSGARVTKDKIFAKEQPRCEMPPYPWQQQHYSHKFSEENNDYTHLEPSHPLLGTRIGPGETIWQNTLDGHLFAYLNEHRVDGECVVPGAAFIEMMLAAAREISKDEVVTITDVSLRMPIMLVPNHAHQLRVQLCCNEQWRVLIKSRLRHQQQQWQLHASCRIVPMVTKPEKPDLDVNKAVTIESSELYQFANSIGLQYGPSFKGLRQIKATPDWAMAKWHCHQSVDMNDYIIHPTLLDACFQLGIAIHLAKKQFASMAMLPVGIGRISIYSDLTALDIIKVKLEQFYSRSATGSVYLYDDKGEILALLQQCRFQAVNFNKANIVSKLNWQNHTKPYQLPISIDNDYLITIIETAKAKQPELLQYNQLLKENNLTDSLQWAHLLNLIDYYQSAEGELSEPESTLWQNYFNSGAVLDYLLGHIITNWPRRARPTVLIVSPHIAELEFVDALVSQQVDVSVLSSQHNAYLSNRVKTEPNLGILPQQQSELSDLIAAKHQFDIVLLYHSLQVESDTQQFQQYLQQLNQILTADGFIVLSHYQQSPLHDLFTQGQQTLTTQSQFAENFSKNHWSISEAISNDDVFTMLAQPLSQQEKPNEILCENYLLLSTDKALASNLSQKLQQMHQQVDVVDYSDGDLASKLHSHLAMEIQCHVVMVISDDNKGYINNFYSFARCIKILASFANDIEVKLSLVYQSEKNDTLNSIAVNSLPGFFRSAVNEYSQLAMKLIQVDDLSLQLTQLAQLLCTSQCNEEEISLHQSLTSYPRIELTSQNPKQLSQQAYLACGDVSNQGERYTWRQIEKRDVQTRQVRIQTKAASLNFRDLMLALKWVPDEAVEQGFFGANLGLEFSGVIMEVGSGVTAFKAGDEVFGFAANSISSEIITTDQCIMLKPKAWDFNQAATIPIAFFTAFYCLVELARLQQNETILVHSAAGGVGLAVIQIAKAIGAKVIATASTQLKRNFLRHYGADEVYSSRDLAFYDEVKAIGVDVIINSLAGDAIDASLQCLNPCGRFLELGKRDYYLNTPIASRPLRQNIEYYGVDADLLLKIKPELCHRVFKQLLQFFSQHHLSPLPYQGIKAQYVDKAFMLMQQSRQMGKLVIDFNHDFAVKVNLPNNNQPIVNDEKAGYLIVGGTNGFGYETALYLAKLGAKHLILIGRSGNIEPQKLTQLEKFNVDVNIYACDVSNEKALRQIITQLTIPLKGVFHAAAAYQDDFIKALTPQSIEHVMAVKLQGCINLHRLTKKMTLDYFVVYSSIAAWFGNPGQALYAAANSGIESLIAQRQQQGLPGKAIAWGAIDCGQLARDEKVKQLLNCFGIKPISVETALQYLQQCLSDSEAITAIAEINWPLLMRQLPSNQYARFSQLQRSLPTINNNESLDDFASAIEGKSQAQVIEKVMDLLVAQISQILSVQAKKIDVTKPVSTLGLDSLMGYELGQSIEQRFNVTIPLMTFVQQPTLTQIAKQITEALLKQKGG